jgi:hypothetical protein
VAIRNGGLEVEGVSWTLPNLQAIDGSQLSVEGMSSLNLPVVTSADAASFVVGASSSLELPALREYRAGLVGDYWSFWNVLGDAVLSLPGLTLLKGSDLADVQFRVNVFGGRVEMNQVHTIQQPVNGSATTILRTRGTESRILLNALTTFGEVGLIDAAAPETIELSSLTQAGLTGVTVTGLTIP